MKTTGKRSSCTSQAASREAGKKDIEATDEKSAAKKSKLVPSNMMENRKPVAASSGRKSRYRKKSDSLNNNSRFRPGLRCHHLETGNISTIQEVTSYAGNKINENKEGDTKLLHASEMAKPNHVIQPDTNDGFLIESAENAKSVHILKSKATDANLLHIDSQSLISVTSIDPINEITASKSTVAEHIVKKRHHKNHQVHITGVTKTFESMRNGEASVSRTPETVQNPETLHSSHDLSNKSTSHEMGYSCDKLDKESHIDQVQYVEACVEERKNLAQMFRESNKILKTTEQDNAKYHQTQLEISLKTEIIGIGHCSEVSRKVAEEIEMADKVESPVAKESVRYKCSTALMLKDTDVVTSTDGTCSGHSEDARICCEARNDAEIYKTDEEANSSVAEVMTDGAMILKRASDKEHATLLDKIAKHENKEVLDDELIEEEEGNITQVKLETTENNAGSQPLEMSNDTNSRNQCSIVLDNADEYNTVSRLKVSKTRCQESTVNDPECTTSNDTQRQKDSITMVPLVTDVKKSVESQKELCQVVGQSSITKSLELTSAFPGSPITNFGSRDMSCDEAEPVHFTERNRGSHSSKANEETEILDEIQTRPVAFSENEAVLGMTGDKLGLAQGSDKYDSGLGTSFNDSTCYSEVSQFRSCSSHPSANDSGELLQSFVDESTEKARRVMVDFSSDENGHMLWATVNQNTTINESPASLSMSNENIGGSQPILENEGPVHVDPDRHDVELALLSSSQVEKSISQGEALLYKHLQPVVEESKVNADTPHHLSQREHQVVISVELSLDEQPQALTEGVVESCREKLDDGLVNAPTMPFPFQTENGLIICVSNPQTSPHKEPDAKEENHCETSQDVLVKLNRETNVQFGSCSLLTSSDVSAPVAIPKTSVPSTAGVDFQAVTCANAGGSSQSHTELFQHSDTCLHDSRSSHKYTNAGDSCIQPKVDVITPQTVACNSTREPANNPVEERQEVKFDANAEDQDFHDEDISDSQLCEMELEAFSTLEKGTTDVMEKGKLAVDDCEAGDIVFTGLLQELITVNNMVRKFKVQYEEACSGSPRPSNIRPTVLPVHVKNIGT